jgi:hypothetical protein
LKTKYFLSETKRFTKLEPIKPAPPINNIFIKLFFLDAHNPYEDIVACIYYIHINKALNLVSVPNMVYPFQASASRHSSLVLNLNF